MGSVGSEGLVVWVGNSPASLSLPVQPGPRVLACAGGTELWVCPQPPEDKAPSGRDPRARTPPPTHCSAPAGQGGLGRPWMWKVRAGVP